MIRFVSEYPAFLPKQRLHVRPWLVAIAKSYGFACRDITYQFLTDDELLQINKDYLQHDYYTDIITFDNREEPGIGPIEADIFISVDRVRENATTYKTDAETELRRVLAHGLLHLCELKDKSTAEERAMRKAEETALALWVEMQKN
jgi:rRNA maturation RNase YbeY